MASNIETPGTYYRIKNWETLFENNRSRLIKRLDWVVLPISIGTDAYAELLDHPDGAAHLGFWCACVMVAGKAHPRGALLRDSGAPHTPTSLARLCNIPAPTCQIGAARLTSLSWLEELPFTKQGLLEGAVIAHKPAGNAQVGAKKTQVGDASRARAEGNRREGNNTPLSPPSFEGGNHHRMSRSEKHKEAAVAEIRRRSEKA